MATLTVAIVALVLFCGPIFTIRALPYDLRQNNAQIFDEVKQELLSLNRRYTDEEQVSFESSSLGTMSIMSIINKLVNVLLI